MSLLYLAICKKQIFLLSFGHYPDYNLYLMLLIWSLSFAEILLLKVFLLPQNFEDLFNDNSLGLY